MVATEVRCGEAEAVAEAKAELLKVFGSLGGVTARAEAFGQVLGRWEAAAVQEALMTLAEEGTVEIAWLSDGAPVYHFVRH